MIVLIAFPELERSLYEKSAKVHGIDGLHTYYDRVDQLLARDREPGGTRFPRVVVVNLDDPARSWERTLAALKSRPKWRKIPVIGFGFLDQENIVADFYGCGGASCVRKPDTYQELEDTVKTMMGYWFNLSILPCDYLREA